MHCNAKIKDYSKFDIASILSPTIQCRRELSDRKYIHMLKTFSTAMVIAFSFFFTMS